MGVDPSAPGSPVLLKVLSVLERHLGRHLVILVSLPHTTREAHVKTPTLKMSDPRPDVKPALAESSVSPDPSLSESTRGVDGKNSDHVVPPLAPPVGAGETQRMEAALGDAVLRFLRIRKGPRKDAFDLDAVGD